MSISYGMSNKSIPFNGQTYSAVPMASYLCKKYKLDQCIGSYETIFVTDKAYSEVCVVCVYCNMSAFVLL